jgi:hypothetical protein
MGQLAGARARAAMHFSLRRPHNRHDLKCDCAGIDPADQRARARRPCQIQFWWPNFSDNLRLQRKFAQIRSIIQAGSGNGA